jgi:hypothetical protein
MTSNGEGHTPRRSSRLSGGAASSRSHSSADEQELATAGGGTVVRRRKKLGANRLDVGEANQQQQDISDQEDRDEGVQEAGQALPLSAEEFQGQADQRAFQQQSPRDIGDSRHLQHPPAQTSAADEEQNRAFQQFWAPPRAGSTSSGIL